MAGTQPEALAGPQPIERTGLPGDAQTGDWAELVSTALVGTDRRPVPGGPSLGAAISAAAGQRSQDPALALLSRAAVASLAWRVGRPPERFDGTLPAPMPPDPRPLIPEAAARRLRTILDSYPKYLPEWLAAVRAAGFRLPPGYFPQLLDLGRTNMLIREDLAAVLGEPGRWLAGASGGWKYLLREARLQLRPEDWQGADPDARIAYVAGLYLSDPQAARQFVREQWATQRVPVKLGLLALVSRYPGPQDVFFVRELIKDPSKQVRDEATLLAGSLERRHEKPPPPEFTAEVARLLAADRGIGRDLHNFVMTRSGEPWPREGALLLLDALAGHGRRGDKAAWTGWIAEQLQSAVADNAPVSVRDRVAALVVDQAVEAALNASALTASAPGASAQGNPPSGNPARIDFATMLALLDFRRDMLAELTPPERAAAPPAQP